MCKPVQETDQVVRHLIDESTSGHIRLDGVVLPTSCSPNDLKLGCFTITASAFERLMRMYNFSKETGMRVSN